MSGAGLGALVALIYFAGGIAQAQAQRAQVTRTADAAAAGSSDAAMQHDGAAAASAPVPPTEPGAPASDRQGRAALAVLTDIAVRAGPAAQPLRLAGALESSRDLDCLAAAVYYEARGESAAGQAAVAQVVLNRARHPAFPKSVCGVVFQGANRRVGCQFSFACDGSMRRSREPAAWMRARAVAAKALGGHVMTEVGQATNFHVARMGRVWGGRMIRIGQVGSHVFYRMDARASALRGGLYAAEAALRSPSNNAVEPTVALSAVPTADGEASYRVATALNSTVEPSASVSAATPEPSAAPVPAAKAAEDSAKPASASATAS